MKTLGYLIALLVLFAGCVSEPAPSEDHMIFSSKSFTFVSGDTVETVSITHSCTCPFSWEATVIPQSAIDITDTDTGWLVFPKKMTGDHHDIPIETRPKYYDSATNHATIIIRSNRYGNDTMQVIAIK
jgi:hypothetical protein